MNLRNPPVKVVVALTLAALGLAFSPAVVIGAAAGAVAALCWKRIPATPVGTLRGRMRGEPSRQTRASNMEKGL